MTNTTTDTVTLASYSDGGGTYLVTRTGDVMTTVINAEAGEWAETLTATLTRRPELDDSEYRADYMISDTFGSMSDEPTYGDVVWIGEEAFSADYDEAQEADEDEGDDEDDVLDCGVIRPGTLGYQHCVRPKDHTPAGHKSQDGGEWDMPTVTERDEDGVLTAEAKHFADGSVQIKLEIPDEDTYMTVVLDAAAWARFTGKTPAYTATVEANGLTTVVIPGYPTLSVRVPAHLTLDSIVADHVAHQTRVDASR